MKLVHPLFGLALLLCLPPASAQESRPASTTEKEQEQRAEMRKEVGEAVDAVRSYSIERRNDATAVARRAMEDADQRAQRLQARLDAQHERMDAAARQGSQEAMSDLRRRRADLSDRAADLRHASRDAWGEARQRFADSYQAFLEAAERMRARLDRDSGEEPPKDTAEEEEER